jgi:hypothetical protein
MVLKDNYMLNMRTVTHTHTHTHTHTQCSIADPNVASSKCFFPSEFEEARRIISALSNLPARIQRIHTHGHTHTHTHIHT